MKICLDGFGVSELKGTGLYTYTYNLIRSLLEYYPQSEYHLLWSQSSSYKPWLCYRNLKYIEELNICRKNNKLKELHKYMENNKIHIFHSLNNGLTYPTIDNPNAHYKFVISVHDFLAFKNEDLVDKAYRIKFQNIFPESAIKADKIIATSENIKKDILDRFNIGEEKIEVINPICSDIFKPMDNYECKIYLKRKFNLTGKFIIFCGSIHPRKNLEVLLKAFKEIQKEIKDLKLIIIGNTNKKRQEYYLKLKKICTEYFIEEKVIFTGTIDLHDMPYFYNSAEVVVNLSSYEGFPQSSMEALACGVPVLCSEEYCFLETFNKLAIQVDENSYVKIKNTILDIINNDNYKKDAMLTSKNIRNTYSKEKSIKKIISLYESFLY